MQMLRLIPVFTGGTCHLLIVMCKATKCVKREQLILELLTITNILLNLQKMSTGSAICLPVTQTLYHISINFNMSSLYYF